MLRVLLLPLVLFTISMACMGQTFQYSRGWTNGKRSSSPGAVVMGGPHMHRDDDGLSDMYELQDGERKLERCLQQLQHFVRNPLVLRSAPFPGTLSLSPNGNSNNNNNNNMFGAHHQSNELYEELNAVEPNDYAKH